MVGRRKERREGEKSGGVERDEREREGGGEWEVRRKARR